jgi:inorganic pyrophosphatase
VFSLSFTGETDWKVIVIDVKDPLADQLNDIADVEKHLPGFIDATREWFRDYKKPDGKPANEFAFDGAAKDKAYATKVIHDTHAAWKRLITGEIPSKAEAYDIKVYVNPLLLLHSRRRPPSTGKLQSTTFFS